MVSTRTSVGFAKRSKVSPGMRRFDRQPGAMRLPSDVASPHGGWDPVRQEVRQRIRRAPAELVTHHAAPGIRDQRQRVLQAAYAAHPERFTRPPTAPTIPRHAWINKPDTTNQPRPLTPATST